MLQNYVLIGTIELLLFCIILYLIIRLNIIVNTAQREVNELYIYLPVAIRDMKYDLRGFNEYIRKKAESNPLDAQEIGFLVGKIFTEVFLTRFNAFPFKKKFLITSILFKFWNLRQRLKATFLKLFLK